MKISFVIIYCLVSSSISVAGISIYTGGNVSAIYPQLSNFKIGDVFGIQKNWGTQYWSLSSGIIYNSKGGIIKDKNFAFNMSESGYNLDIHVSVDYLEIPLFLKLYNPINKKMKIGISFGPSLAIAISDNTESKTLKYFTFNSSDPKNNIKIDYWENFEPGPVWAECSMICMNVGLIYKISDFFIEIRYNRAINAVHTVASKDINKRLHSFNFLIGVEIF